jgi:hypothetical protein
MIIHRNTDNGLNEARRASEIIKHSFPNAQIILKAQGRHKNLVIEYKNTTIFDRNKGDGYLNTSRVTKFIAKLAKIVKATETNNWRSERTLSDEAS